MGRHVALLRGINVGGNNIIKMAALKTCFEDNGFRDVATYIQSGNVIFEAPREKGLPARIEALLSKAFGYAASVVLCSHEQMRAVVDGAPPGFGSRPARFRYNVLFLKEPLTGAAAMKSVKVRDGVDQAHAGRRVIYFSNLISKASQSQLRYIISQPIYGSLTIRNWNTTQKLLHLLDAGG